MVNGLLGVILPLPREQRCLFLGIQCRRLQPGCGHDTYSVQIDSCLLPDLFQLSNLCASVFRSICWPVISFFPWALILINSGWMICNSLKICCSGMSHVPELEVGESCMKIASHRCSLGWQQHWQQRSGVTTSLHFTNEFQGHTWLTFCWSQTQSFNVV